MRLVFVSDLHAEYQMEVCGLVAARARDLDADLLVVAGDVSPDIDLLGRCLNVLSSGAPRVLFLPGNHDLWTMDPVGQGPDSAQLYRDVLPELCHRVHVDYLGLSSVVVGDVTFCGVTGWYDFSLRNPELDIPIESYESGRFQGVECADRRFFRWLRGGRRLSDREVSAWMVETLERQLDAAGEGPKVVVTHFMPGATPLVATGVAEMDFVMGFLGDEHLGHVADRAAGVVRYLSGHWHRAFRTLRHGVTGDYVWEASPVGYPREMPGSLQERVLQATRLVEL